MKLNIKLHSKKIVVCQLLVEIIQRVALLLNFLNVYTLLIPRMMELPWATAIKAEITQNALVGINMHLHCIYSVSYYINQDIMIKVMYSRN